MIDVIVPCLNRTQNVRPLIDSLASSGADASLIFVCTYTDYPQIRAVMESGSRMLIADWPAETGDYAKKTNLGFGLTDSEFILNGADDIQFTRGWDTHALASMTDNIGVVATNDMANRQVMRGEFGTHNLIRRSYIEEFGGTFDETPGVVMHEGYDHWYVDRELCDVARARGAFAFAKRSVVRHRHPIFDRRIKTDATYLKGQAHAREDHTLYMRRFASFTPRNRDIVSR